MSNNAICQLFNVTIFHTWDESGNGSHFTCGSLDGAKDFVAEKIEKGDVDSYSIEGFDYIPCDATNPGGQLYLGCVHFEYKEVA